MRMGQDAWSGYVYLYGGGRTICWLRVRSAQSTCGGSAALSSVPCNFRAPSAVWFVWAIASEMYRGMRVGRTIPPSFQNTGGAEYGRESGTQWMSTGAKRQCGRALALSPQG